MVDFNDDAVKHLHFSEFPDDLIEEILAWLPVEYLGRFATVCKQWNTLFSSTGFITEQWASAPSNKKPWLVVGDVEDSRGYFSAYSSFTRNWKMPCLSLSSLSFLEGELAPSGSWYINSSPFCCLGSASGLFLIGQLSTSSTYVCNPLTGNLLILPPMNFINCAESTVRGIVQEGQNGYKVIALDYSSRHEQKIVEIYDSAEKAWRVAGFLPRILRFREDDVLGDRMVFCEGFFYCLAETELVVFNMRDGTSFFVPLPEDIETGLLFYIQLVTCGSRILLVAGIGFPILERIDEYLEELHKVTTGLAGEVISWEFDKKAVTPNWKEIQRRRTILFGSSECVGMGDCVYLKQRCSRAIAVCSLTQNSWAFLPTCPTARAADVEPPTFTVLTKFEPRPDMKVQ